MSFKYLYTLSKVECVYVSVGSTPLPDHVVGQGSLVLALKPGLYDCSTYGLLL